MQKLLVFLTGALLTVMVISYRNGRDRIRVRQPLCEQLFLVRIFCSGSELNRRPGGSKPGALRTSPTKLTFGGFDKQGLRYALIQDMVRVEHR